MNPVAIVAIVLGAFVMLAVVAYSVSYNRLRRDANKVAEAWAAVDAELANRHALVPQLVEAVKAAAAHEQALLVRAAAAHAHAVAAAHTPVAASAAEPPVARAAAELVALRERYPQLNSQHNFLDLQERLSLIEDRIAAARRYHNMLVAKLNRRCEAFPSSIVAARHGIERADYFEI